jgi:hypothetical protein
MRRPSPRKARVAGMQARRWTRSVDCVAGGPAARGETHQLSRAGVVLREGQRSFAPRRRYVAEGCVRSQIGESGRQGKDAGARLWRLGTMRFRFHVPTSFRPLKRRKYSNTRSGAGNPAMTMHMRLVRSTDLPWGDHLPLRRVESHVDEVALPTATGSSATDRYMRRREHYETVSCAGDRWPGRSRGARPPRRPRR